MPVSLRTPARFALLPAALVLWAATGHRIDQPAPLAAIVLGVGLMALGAIRRQERSRRAAEAALRTSEERFRALIQNASDMILVVAPDGCIRSATGAARALLDEDPDTLVGRSLAKLVTAADRPVVASFLDGARDSEPGATVSTGWRMRTGRKQSVDVEVTAANLIADAHIGGLVLTCRDVSARKAFEEQLRHRAFHDPLTQLPNRALLLDRVEQALARPERRVAILFVDLDDFKVVNDTLGHAAGDGLLTAVAARLRGCLRSADTAARLGGDEFAILLEELCEDDEADRVAARILDTLRRPFSVHGEPVQIAVSIGVVVATAGAIDVDELLRRADFAMYSAKRKGKGHAERFDPAIEADLMEHFEPTAPVNEEAERVTWFARAEEQRAEIEAVLADPDGRITQVFQPIVDLRSGLVTGYEALSRFVGSRRPPNAWFAQAHRCGLGIELEICAVQAQLAAPNRPAGTYLSVNLSASALLSAETDGQLGDDLSSLVIEVTEDELVAEGPSLEARLAELRRRGARLAVDDIGAGYAGLKQVVRLAPDVLKLDRSIVDGVAADPAKEAMIDALVRYARRIGAAVCAEGIETLEDLLVLADLDVTYGQGYGLARPGPPWPAVSPDAASACRSALGAVIRHDELDTAAIRTSERELERVCHQISGVTSHDHLRRLLEPIRRFLDVDEVSLSLLDASGLWLTTVLAGQDIDEDPYALADYPATVAILESGEALQVLASDPAADAAEVEVLAELGFRAMLMVPLSAAGRGVGVIEVYSVAERPWSRTQIHRTRIISHQLGLVLSQHSSGGVTPAAT